MRADSGVLSVPTGKSLSINTMGYFETKSFRDNFRSYLKERRDDTVDSMFLAGTYNPFIREQGFPPIHINLNYLIDPSALVYSAAYDKLYDEHAIGPCDSRADPLHIPGTARFPFDPNSHPTPTEVEIPWWKIVQEFFISD